MIEFTCGRSPLAHCTNWGLVGIADSEATASRLADGEATASRIADGVSSLCTSLFSLVHFAGKVMAGKVMCKVNK